MYEPEWCADCGLSGHNEMNCPMCQWCGNHQLHCTCDEEDYD